MAIRYYLRESNLYYLKRLYKTTIQNYRHLKNKALIKKGWRSAPGSLFFIRELCKVNHETAAMCMTATGDPAGATLLPQHGAARGKKRPARASP